MRAKAERRASAKAEQLKQAFLMAEADARMRQLEEFLGRLESEILGLSTPYPERAAIWIQVVRAARRQGSSRGNAGPLPQHAFLGNLAPGLVAARGGGRVSRD